MDAEAFALARNVQLKQLVNSFPHAGVDTAQSKWISESIDDDSTTPSALLAFARQTADTNNRQALLFFNRTAPFHSDAFSIA